MKTKVLIISFLVVSLLGAFSLKAHSQEERRPSLRCNTANVAVAKKDSILIADETIMTHQKTGAKIHCSNETVFDKLFTTHGVLFKRFTCTWKTDRHGRYKDYVIYLSDGDADIIKSWAKKKNL